MDTTHGRQPMHLKENGTPANQTKIRNKGGVQKKKAQNLKATMKGNEASVVENRNRRGKAIQTS